jgi:hypothetical protein
MTEYYIIFSLKYKLLPNDIIRYLFDFIPSKIYYYKEMQTYFQLLNVVHGDEYSNIYIKLSNLVFKNIINNAHILEYVLSKNKIFRQNYKDEIIDNKKRFRLMDKENSFLYSIIMTMHH